MSEKVYISYCWEDERLVDEIDEFLKKEHLVIKRDNRDLKYGASIEEYAKEMRQGKYIICVISSGYLKSINCMYEVVQLLKDDNFVKDKFCPVLVDSVSEKVDLSPIGIEKYAAFWEEQIKKQNLVIERISGNVYKNEQIEHLKKLEEIYRAIRGFLYSIRDSIYIHSSEIEEKGIHILNRLFEKIQLNGNLKIERESVDSEKINRSLLAEKHIFKSGKSYLYTRGTGKAYVQAFIPAHYSEKICCHIDTLQMSNGKGIYTMDEKDVLEYLFSRIGEWEDLNKRKWCKQYTDGRWIIILPNYRLEVSFEEIRDLALILDDLYSEYQKSLRKIERILGVEKYKYEKFDEIKILEVDKEYWSKVYNFMREHTCDRELSEWNIFNVNLRPNRIQIIRNDNERHYRKGVSEGIHVQLIVKEKTSHSNIVEIYWKPGFVISAYDEMKYFDNSILWKADYTYEWLVNELIPKAIFEDLQFYKKALYRTYKSDKFFEDYINC